MQARTITTTVAFAVMFSAVLLATSCSKKNEENTPPSETAKTKTAKSPQKAAEEKTLRQRKTKIPPAGHLTWDQVYLPTPPKKRKLRLVLEESYNSTKHSHVDLLKVPLTKLIENYLRCSDVALASSTDKADATLHIVIEGEYRTRPTDFVHMGSNVRVTKEYLNLRVKMLFEEAAQSQTEAAIDASFPQFRTESWSKATWRNIGHSDLVGTLSRLLADGMKVDETWCLLSTLNDTDYSLSAAFRLAELMYPDYERAYETYFKGKLKPVIRKVEPFGKREFKARIRMFKRSGITVTVLYSLPFNPGIFMGDNHYLINNSWKHLKRNYIKKDAWNKVELDSFIQALWKEKHQNRQRLARIFSHPRSMEVFKYQLKKKRSPLMHKAVSGLLKQIGDEKTQ